VRRGVQGGRGTGAGRARESSGDAHRPASPGRWPGPHRLAAADGVSSIHFSYQWNPDAEAARLFLSGAILARRDAIRPVVLDYVTTLVAGPLAENLNDGVTPGRISA
jgi:hypothetical protein